MDRLHHCNGHLKLDGCWWDMTAESPSALGAALQRHPVDFRPLGGEGDLPGCMERAQFRAGDMAKGYTRELQILSSESGHRFWKPMIPHSRCPSPQKSSEQVENLLP